MIEKTSGEKELWSKVTAMLGTGKKVLGRHWSFNLLSDPKRLGFVLSRYKFAAKMTGRKKRLLELGCSEGIGTPILAEFAASYTGVDMDSSAIATANENWENANWKFIEADFMGQRYGAFDSIVSLDVIEHIHREYESLFFDTVEKNLGEDGICMIGTPNITSAPYASVGSQRGHVNLYDAARLEAAMRKVFHNVFMFGLNDEIVHTGYAPMTHYLMALGCNKRTGGT
jgi:2-polyprenyl-3-methyl-5-hydroxy-6-metoxy-1,4-benzoquinol methylase